MTHFGLLLFHAAVLLVGPIFVVGLINRTKAIWGGRKGPQLNQIFFDLVRLVRKTPVYSEVTTWVFPVSATVVLVTTLLTAAIAPVVPGYAPWSAPCDFVFFAYLMGLGRIFIMLGALDTGSAFEGMGASREGTYAALIEPAFFITLGTLALASGQTTFESIFNSAGPWHVTLFLKLSCLVSLFILLQTESARVPVDDPTTHLELTMIHEVMILDHSGPELAQIQYAAAMKTTIYAGLIAALLNPFGATESPVLAAIASLVLIALTSIGVGLVESLMARLRFQTLPYYSFAALVAAVVSLSLLAINHGAFP